MADLQQLELWGWKTKEFWDMIPDYWIRRKYVADKVDNEFKHELALLASAVERGVYLDFDYKLKLSRYMRNTRKKVGYEK